MILSGAELKQRMSELTAGRWSPRRSKFQDYADARYFLPSRTELDYLLGHTHIPEGGAVKEVFDCDDFAFLLKGTIAHSFRQRLFRPNGGANAGLCFGVAWGRFSSPPANGENHALNWCLIRSGSESELLFVEPQGKRILPRSVLEGDLWLLLA